MLAELARRGFVTIAEPGLRVVEEQRNCGGRALPWVDLAAFARRALELAKSDLARASKVDGPVFFDRGIVDAAALAHLGEGELASLAEGQDGYSRIAFIAPPWPAIYCRDEDRQHGFEEAVAEYERLVPAYRALAFEAVELPRETVGTRADFVIRHIGAG
ncbi:hypothetical protein TMRO357_00932 [Alteriqipengyuania sp. 357]